MGDIADSFIERLIDPFCNDGDEESYQQEKVCGTCGAYPLYWKQIDGKWRLADEKGTVHVCDPFAGVKPTVRKKNRK